MAVFWYASALAIRGSWWSGKAGRVASGVGRFELDLTFGAAKSSRRDGMVLAEMQVDNYNSDEVAIERGAGETSTIDGYKCCDNRACERQGERAVILSRSRSRSR